MKSSSDQASRRHDEQAHARLEIDSDHTLNHHQPQNDTLVKLIFKLTGVAIIFRIAIILWIIIVDYLVKDYDSSSYVDTFFNHSTGNINEDGHQMKIINYTLENPLYYGRGFAHWDGVFFLRIASTGQYEFESFFAFFPLYPMAIRTLTLYVMRPFMSVLTSVTNFQVQNNHGVTPFMISGVLISNICFVISVVVFIKLTWELVGRNPAYTNFVRTSTLLYIFNPATVFMSVVYTESMFSLFSLCGMYYHMRKRHLLSCLFFSLATCTRGNGIALAGFYMFQFMLEEFLRWKNSKRQDWTRNCFNTIKGFLKYIVFGCSMVWLPYVAFQAFGYYKFCTEKSNQLALTIIETLNAKRHPASVNIHFKDYLARIHPWCLSTIPHLYGYVQSKYWNVGFLKYYELKQVPNFMLAFPVIFISLSGIVQYARHNKQFFLSLGLFPPTSPTSQPHTQQTQDHSESSAQSARHDSNGTTSYYLNNKSMLVFVYYWLALILQGLAIMHIQVLTRFVSSALPIFFWFSAHIVLTSTSKIVSNLILIYFLSYALIGCILFSNFYPWS